MLLYKYENVPQEYLDKIICDKCKDEITDDMEKQEMYYIRFMGGYNSVFGDMNTIECDICQSCLYDMIKDIYRIREE